MASNRHLARCRQSPFVAFALPIRLTDYGTVRSARCSRRIPVCRPVALLEEIRQLRLSRSDWIELRRSLESVGFGTWRAEHGADREEVIFRQDHVPGQPALSDFTDMADVGVSIAGQTLDHRLYHFVLAYSAWGSMPSRCWSGEEFPPRLPSVPCPERSLVARRRAG